MYKSVWNTNQQKEYSYIQNPRMFDYHFKQDIPVKVLIMTAEASNYKVVIKIFDSSKSQLLLVNTIHRVQNCQNVTFVFCTKRVNLLVKQILEF